MTATAQRRLDTVLVDRGLARSRRVAAELVADGRVQVGGSVARKPSQVVPADVVVDVRADGTEYVSRAAHKLLGALADLADLGAAPPAIHDAVCLDAGASTGGFTQVLLEHGARSVVAVDVGHGQLAGTLRADPRVDAREGLNVRDLTADDLTVAPTVVVGDLSFISLGLVLPALVGVAAPGADLLLLVKPQFEVGRERLGSGGVVRSTTLRAEAVVGVARAAAACGATVQAVLPSRLPGPAGNHEYVLRLSRGEAAGAPLPDDVATALAAAVAAGRPALVDGEAHA